MGSLIACREGKYRDKVFYVAGGRRRHLLHPDWVEANGFAWTDLQWVSEETLSALPLAAPVPRRWSEAEFQCPPLSTMAALREIITSQITGQGLEFGAGSNPLPAPLECHVRYADRIEPGHFRNQYHDGADADTVTPDLSCEIECMDVIPARSLDFVLACHVIEHTPNPLGAFREVYLKLRAGGQFVLVVPDRLRTFDRCREPTPLDHVILDFEEPCRDRDLWHYLEFYTKPFPQPMEGLYEFIQEKFARRHDIHYHTWDYESFSRMVGHARGAMAPFASVWSHPAPVEHGGTEFYFVLTK